MYNTIVTLKKGEGRTLKAGGMWVFDNEIASIMGDFENGDIIAIHDFDGYFMGYGYINTNSKITIRLLARRKDTVIDEAFFEQRVRDAWNYRKETIDTSSCRLIFGEADFLPGIVIDKFSDVLVVESLALGIDKWKLVIIDALKKVLAEDGITIRGVYERSDELAECIPAAHNTEEAVEAAELERSINAFLHTLSEQECNVFLRRYWFVEEYAEIAGRYGMNLNTVKTSLFRTRKKLQKYLEQQGIVL